MTPGDGPIRRISRLRSPAAVTADDWGMTRGVNEGILRLATIGVVRRVSILATARHTGHRLDELVRVPEIELGLHLNLTFGCFDSGSTLLRHSGPGSFHLRWLRAGAEGRKIVRAELRNQLVRLRSMDVHVRYLDSHHHVHLAPGLLDAISDILHEFRVSRVRLPIDPGLWKTRRLPVLLLALAAKRSLKRHGFDHLPCFYPTPEHFHHRRRLANALAYRCARYREFEVITHPAAFNDLEELEWPDPVRQERVTEFEALLATAPAAEKKRGEGTESCSLSAAGSAP